MSTNTTPKKPPANSTSGRKTAGSTNIPSTNGGALHRSPSRTTTDSSTTRSGTTNTASHARSMRDSVVAPLSARAAARKPSVYDGSNDTEDQDIKAELQAKLDELQTRLREAELANETSQKQAVNLQARLDEAIREQAVLEEREAEHLERLEELTTESREGVRARRELEQIYEETLREKDAALAREEEMHATMQRLRESIAQKEIRDRSAGLQAGSDDDLSRPGGVSRSASFRNGSPSGDRHFAPSSSIQRSDSRSSSRLIMQKDKVIEGLRLDLAEAQIRLVELENQGGGRVHELQKDLYEAKIQNGRLIEENESFQLLLSEKTLNGDLAHSELLRAPSGSGSRPPSRAPQTGASLADELAGQHDETESSEGAENQGATRQLQNEVQSLKDQNKALTLYINNIISRLLQHEQFEQILDKTPDLMAGPGAASVRYGANAGDLDKDLPQPPPPSPPPKNETSAAAAPPATGGLLQRARSVMGGAGRPRPRPTSIYQALAATNQTEPRSNEDPDSAPRIPLGRSMSTRGHRRTNSDWPAASVTSMMYRGPTSGLQGPSPGLTTPTLTNRTSFFATATSPQPPTATRTPSGSGVVQSISGLENKENQLPPLSHQTSNRTNSITSNPVQLSETDQVEPPAVAAASPPRSISSNSGSGDRDRNDSRPGGAIMTGSKPRPLRLVQEAADDDKARRAANRGSWFGWMNKAGSGGSGGSGGAVPGLSSPPPQ